MGSCLAVTGLEAQLELSLDFGNVSYLRVVNKRLTIARMGRKLARCGHFQRFNNRLQPRAPAYAGTGALEQAPRIRTVLPLPFWPTIRVSGL